MDRLRICFEGEQRHCPKADSLSPRQDVSCMDGISPICGELLPHRMELGGLPGGGFKGGC